MNVVHEVQNLVETVNEISILLKQHETWQREQRILGAGQQLNMIMERVGWKDRLK